jgi:multiple sugar transport system permease protein
MIGTPVARARAGQTTAGPARRRPGWLTPALFIAPALAIMALVLGYPVLNAIWTSLNADFLTKPDADHFVGLGNFTALLLHDPTFWKTVLRTVIWAVANLIPQIVLGLVLALILHRRLLARGFVRSVVIIPWIVPTVVVAFLWLFLLDPTSGPLNNLLKSTGIMDNPPIWFSDASSAFPVLILVSLWKWTPFVTVILLGALQTVPPELEEAAVIDGAGKFQRFRYVVVPHISTSIALASLLTIAYSVNNFNGIWLFTQGGPAGATDTLTTLAYRTAFKEYDFGMAAAISVVIFVGLLGISALYFYVIEGRQNRKGRRA